MSTPSMHRSIVRAKKTPDTLSEQTIIKKYTVSKEQQQYDDELERKCAELQQLRKTPKKSPLTESQLLRNIPAHINNSSSAAGNFLRSKSYSSQGPEEEMEIKQEPASLDVNKTNEVSYEDDMESVLNRIP